MGPCLGNERANEQLSPETVERTDDDENDDALVLNCGKVYGSSMLSSLHRQGWLVRWIFLLLSRRLSLFYFFVSRRLFCFRRRKDGQARYTLCSIVAFYGDIVQYVLLFRRMCMSELESLISFSHYHAT